MELDPILQTFWVPFYTPRFHIGLTPLWLCLIEARRGVKRREGERKGAPPPFLGGLRVRHPLPFYMACARTRSPPGWGRSLVIYPCGKARTRA